MLVDEENFISGIHNYCDRWCERCTFTARCRVFAMEQEDPDLDGDIDSETLVRKLKASLAEAKSMILEKAEEFGIEFEPISDEEFREIQARERENINDQEVMQLAETYFRNAKSVLEDKDEWLIFTAADEEAQAEMLSIIYWYQYFIAGKINHGLHGLLDFDGNFDEEELNDPQSDANGSIKIALIAIERSIMAWTNLMVKENSPQIKPLLDLLETIRQKCKEKFPNAPDFIRPGFDEVEIVM